MKNWPPVVYALLSLANAAWAAEAPSIVTASPAFWATGIAPSTREVSLTFDQPMAPGFTAWLGRSSIAPEVDLNSKVSEDRRIFTLRVSSLESGKVYVFALNEKGIPGVGFQNEKGRSLPPTYLVFQTAGTPAADDAPPRALASSPATNAQQVDPAKLKAITLQFDRPMQTAKHGLQMLEDKKELDLSKASFRYSPDGKTFTLFYDFKPAANYELQLNSTQNIGFASKQRVPLWPVRFSFSTAPAP